MLRFGRHQGYEVELDLILKGNNRALDYYRFEGSAILP